MSRLLTNYNCEGMVIPVVCSLEEYTVKRKEWRNGKYSSSYKQPVDNIAHVMFHVTVINRAGDVVYDATGTSKKKKPILYSLFKKRRKERDTESLSKKMYGPPMLRALRDAVYNSLQSWY